MTRAFLPTLNPSPLGREVGRALHEGRDLPPLRGGIKGGVTRVQMLQRQSMTRALLPLNPSPLGREAGRAFQEPAEMPCCRSV